MNGRHPPVWRSCHRCGREYNVPRFSCELPCHGACYSPRRPLAADAAGQRSSNAEDVLPISHESRKSSHGAPIVGDVKS